MRVAIIGAGVSGLAAIKCCRDEGLDVVCFERRNDLGGVWNYTETLEPEQSNVTRFVTGGTMFLYMADRLSVRPFVRCQTCEYDIWQELISRSDSQRLLAINVLNLLDSSVLQILEVVVDANALDYV